ncbi:chmp4b, partial [Cordylochernes scorpioides]
MSFITKLFGTGKGGSNKPPTPAEAIQSLRNVEEMLVKKQEYLEKKVEAEIAIAKKHGSKNKRLALSALKRKNRYQKQLQQIDGTLTTIEFQREALENASTNTEVLKIMSGAAKSLKAAHQDVMDPDKVHDLLAEIQEQQELATEISDAISNPTGFGYDIDEDELEKELEDLEQEEFDRQALNVPSLDTESLPSPPTAVPAAAAKAKVEEEEDDELSRLRAWA